MNKKQIKKRNKNNYDFRSNLFIKFMLILYSMLFFVLIIYMIMYFIIFKINTKNKIVPLEKINKKIILKDLNHIQTTINDIFNISLNHETLIKIYINLINNLIQVKDIQNYKLIKSYIYNFETLVKIACNKNIKNKDLIKENNLLINKNNKLTKSYNNQKKIIKMLMEMLKNKKLKIKKNNSTLTKTKINNDNLKEICDNQNNFKNLKHTIYV